MLVSLVKKLKNIISQFVGSKSFECLDISDVKANIVVKDNKLNLVTYFNSVIQLKLLSRFIVEIISKPKNDLYEIEINEVLKTFGINKKDTPRIKKLAKAMMKPLEVPEYIRKKTGFNLSVLFTDVDISDPPYIKFEVNKKLKPFVLELKNNFSFYFLKNVSNLSSSSSYRLYELLKQWQDGKNNRGWFSVELEELKSVLGVENKYKLYGHFKERVLNKNQKELLEKTDIRFTFEEKKRGRRVERIVFNIFDNTKTVAIDDSDFINDTSIKKLLLFGLNKDRLLKQWGLIEREIFTGKIDYVKNTSEWFSLLVTQNSDVLGGEKTKRNPQAWLMKVIECRGINKNSIKTKKKQLLLNDLNIKKQTKEKEYKEVLCSIEDIKKQGRMLHFSDLSKNKIKAFLEEKMSSGTDAEKNIVSNYNLLNEPDNIQYKHFIMLGYSFPRSLPRELRKQLTLHKKGEVCLKKDIQKLQKKIEAL